MISFDRNRLFYKQLLLLGNSTVKVPKGEVWEVVAFFRHDNLPEKEVLQKALFYYDHFCKNSNLPNDDPFPDFRDMFKPKISFIDKRIPYLLNEHESLDALPVPGGFVVLQFEILPFGVDKETEYWKRST